MAFFNSVKAVNMVEREGPLLVVADLPSNSVNSSILQGKL
jgi:hypothetical protein